MAILGTCVKFQVAEILMLTLFWFLCSGWSLQVMAAVSVHVVTVARQHDRVLFLFSQPQNQFGKCVLLQMVFSVNEIPMHEVII